MVQKNFEGKPLNGPLYAILYPFMAARAHECGYALALHGTLGRDLDLIAAPWIQDAKSPEELVAHILKWMDDQVELFDQDRNGEVGLKPHGRRCWSLHLKAWTGAYIDLSVMPRTVTT